MAGAWSRLFKRGGERRLAAPPAEAPSRANLSARVENKRILLRHPFLTVEEVVIAPRRPDGELTPSITRINVDRGDSVAALIYEPARRLLHFTQQFRYSTYDFDNEGAADNGWLIELLAGRLADNHGADEIETPEAAMRREIAEESNFTVLSIEPLSEFFLSPGASSERLYLFFATVEAPPAGSGRAHFGTDDELIFDVVMTPDQFFDAIERDRVRDAKMICGAEWLRRNPDRLR